MPERWRQREHAMKFLGDHGCRLPNTASETFEAVRSLSLCVLSCYDSTDSVRPIDSCPLLNHVLKTLKEIMPFYEKHA